MKFVKLIGCAALGVLAGAVGLIVSPGPLEQAALGAVLGVAVIAAGSMLAGEIAGLGGGFLYACAAFAATLWWQSFSPQSDFLAMPSSAVATVWPLVTAVSALIPLRFLRSSD